MKILLLILCFLSSQLFAQGRIALVIGNSNYENEKSLKNPINDAVSIAHVLKNDLDFSYVKLLKNVKRRDFINELALFKDKAQTADTVVFYFSGHGQQNNKSNYLLPVDARIERSEHIKAESIDVDDIVNSFESTPSKVKLIILDACRDNPFSNKTKSLNKGLSRPTNIEEGTLIAFATSDGEVALDGNGNDKNSPYAQALITHLKNARNIPIQQILDNVSDQVKIATNGNQKPKRYGDMKVNVYLVPEKINNNSNFKIEANLNLEKEYWSSIKNSDDIADFLAYLKKFPTGNFKELAENAIIRLNKKNPANAIINNSPTDSSTINSINLSEVEPEDSKNRYKVGDTIKDCPYCPELVVIPKGKFIMGSNQDEPERESNEGPVQAITIDYEIAVGKFEITKKEFSFFVEQTNYKTDAENKGGCFIINPGYRFIEPYWQRDPSVNWRNPLLKQNENHPVTCISWNDAKAYLKWLNSIDPSKNFRLLSESEWEYMARGNTQSIFSTGNTLSENQANMNMDFPYNGSSRGSVSYNTKEVGQYKPNNFGIYDVHGNVAELVEDSYEPSLVNKPSNGLPVNQESRRNAVIRGGGWYQISTYGRSASRQNTTKDSAVRYLGFRICRTL